MKALLLALALALPQAATAACREDVVELRGDWGSARFRIDVADTAAERAQGLMHVEQMDAGVGMLFVYERPQPVAFWMRNTLIPLDMLFFDSSGTMVRLHEMAVPLDETPIPGGSSVQYVLEINGGISGDMGITRPTEMRHPSIPRGKAAWAC